MGSLDFNCFNPNVDVNVCYEVAVNKSDKRKLMATARAGEQHSTIS